MHINCLQSVLQFLKPFSRFQISRRCPSIEYIEKNVPLHINFLDITQNTVAINQFEYCLDLSVNDGNESSMNYDPDDYGVMDYEMRVENRPNEILIDNRKELNGDYALNVDVFEEDAREVAQIVDEDLRARAQEKLNEEVRQASHEILRSISRFSKIPSMTMRGVEPYSYRIEFCIRRYECPFESESMAYEKKLHDAQFYVLEKLLGGRTSIKIHRLSVFTNGILRLPSNLNITVNSLTIPKPYFCANYTNEILDALRPLLQVSSLPLKSLSILGARKFADPIIQTACFLITSNSEELSTLRNMGAGIPDFDENVEVRIAEILGSWLTEGRPIGTNHAFTMNHEISANLVIEVVLKKFAERILRVDQSDVNHTEIVLHISSTTELTVTCGWDQGHRKWYLRLIVDTVNVFSENSMEF